MTIRHAGLRRLGSKAGSFLVSGALALSLTPAVAFANTGLEAGSINNALIAQDDSSTTLPTVTENATGEAVSAYENVDKAIVADYGDPLGDDKVKKVSEDGNKVKYLAYAHSDGSHYKAYSLYTEMTIEDGVLKAIDFSSANDTFAGAWGYMKDPIEGMLPEGVSFSVTKNSDGTYSPVLSGDPLKNYGFDLSVTLWSTNAEGADALGEKSDTGSSGGAGGKGGKGGKGGGSSSGPAGAAKYELPEGAAPLYNDGKLTIPGATATGKEEGYYNLVQCAYTIGTGSSGDKHVFNVWFSVGNKAELANKYIQSIKTTKYSETGYDETNRDGWTGIMGTLVLRQLDSWRATLKDQSLIAKEDGYGEIGDIVAVSGATKTSNAFLWALQKEVNNISDVADDVSITIDGAKPNTAATKNSINFGTDPQDLTKVTKNSDGTFTVNAQHRAYGGGRLSLLNVYLYDMSGKAIGSQGVLNLAKESFADKTPNNVAPVKQYNDTDKVALRDNPDKVGKLINYSADATEQTLDSVNDENASLSYANSGGGDNNNTLPITLKVKNRNVTHVVFKYLLGHASFAIAYDLEDMSKVDSVSEKLGAISDTSDTETIAAARVALNSLNYDAWSFVANKDKLAAAYSKLSEDSKKAVDDYVNKYTLAKVDVAPASLTYSGKALEPEVTVTAVNGDKVEPANYEAVYENNTNAGTATVTVSGKGNYANSASVQATFTIGKAAQKVTVSAASVSKKFGDKAFNVGAKRTAGDGALTYASSNAKVATVDKAGNVTIKGKGSATITATAAATGNYNAASATTKLTVAAGSNPFTLKAANKTVKAAKVKKAKQTVAVSKLSGNKGGAVTYAVSKWNKAKAKKYFSIAKKTGKVTVKKGTPKGTYKFTVKATSAAKGNYAKTAKTVVVTVKVK